MVTCASVIQITAVSAAPSGGALPPPLMLVLHVTDRSDVPDDAIGAALNVTVTEPMAPGFLTVFPCGARPLASNVNYVAGQTVPNFVVTGLDVDGDVCIEVMATTDVIVDIAGYIPAGSSIVPLTAPQRFVDTREGVGAPKSRVAGGTVLEVQLAGGSGVPVDATTVVFNATAVHPVGAGFLTVFPCGQSIPETSTLNFTGGAIVPNLVVSAVGVGGKVCFYSNVETDIVADVAAFAVGRDGIATLDRPLRIVDTRIGLGGPLAQVGAVNRVVQVGGTAGSPADATAAIVNLTATAAADNGYVAAFPCGGTVPLVSNLNFRANTNVANMAIVQLAADGTLCLTANRAVDLVVDVLGYTQGPNAFVPLKPARMHDSREYGLPTCNLAVRSFEGVLGVIDLVSGAVRPLDVSPVAVGVPPTVLIDSTCHIFVLQGPVPFAAQPTPPPPFSNPFPPTTSEYDREGHLLRTFYGPPRFDAFATPYGLFNVRNGEAPAVIDAVTREVVFDLPVTGRTDHGDSRFWKSIGVTDDGLLFAMSVNAPTGFNQQVVYFSIAGEMLGIFTVPEGYTPLSMSPDGVYIALAKWRTMSLEFAIEVRTLDLTEVVSTSPYEGHWNGQSVPLPKFLGSSALYGCVMIPGGSKATKWQLFSDSLTSMIPALPDELCVLAAG